MGERAMQPPCFTSYPLRACTQSCFHAAGVAAFVPRIHNRDAPVANRQAHWRAQISAKTKHGAALEKAKPRIDNKWGTSWNGLRDLKKPFYPHVRSNLKGAQLQDERFQAIELENYLLLGKLSKILERPHNPTLRTREWGGGIRLTSNQVPVIDHCIPQQTTEFGAAIELASLNIGIRRQQHDRIAAENRELVKRLQMSKPTYQKAKFLEDWQLRERWLLNQRVANRALIVEEAPTTGRSRPASAHIRQPSFASTTASEGVARRRPDRPQTALPRGPREQTAPIEASLVMALNLLASMNEATSLAQVRLKRDTLMDETFEFPPELELSQIAQSTAGVPIEVIVPRGASGDAVLMLGERNPLARPCIHPDYIYHEP